MKEILHLLVVDDELGMRLSVERALRNYSTFFEDIEAEVSFRIDTAESGEDALDLVARDPVDILLLDYKLPGISGMDVLQVLGERKVDTLGVMITAYANLETAVLATNHVESGHAAALATSRAVSTSMVEQSISSVPGLAFSIMPPTPM